MEIDGPLKIKVVNDPTQSGYQLLIDFTPEFRALPEVEQGADFQRYRQSLKEGIAQLSSGDRNRDGMALVLQLVDSLMPHVEAGELELEETLVVQIGEEAPEVSLTDLFRND
ncbi:MAG TPA: transcriptional regulator [Chromatiales bacterium]|nr:transcriptional regulator [Chromatiales bacterium]